MVEMIVRVIVMVMIGDGGGVMMDMMVVEGMVN